MGFPKRNQRWTNDEHEKLKSTFLEQAVMFNPSKFGFEMGRSSTSITTRITCMINPLDKMYDEDFAKKVKILFPDDGPEGELASILYGRKSWG